MYHVACSGFRKMHDYHVVSLERSRKRRKEDAKENGIKRSMSQEEVDKEVVEMKVKPNVIIELLQEGKEDKQRRWIRRKKVNWKKLQVKLEHRLNGQLNDKAHNDKDKCSPIVN